MDEAARGGLDTEDLQDSAPLRDFTRLATQPRAFAVCPLPERREDGRAWGAVLAKLDAPALTRLLCAAVAVLLARHTRRRSVSFLLSRRVSEPVQAIRLDTPPEAGFGALLDAAGQQLAAGAARHDAPEHGWTGCVLDLALDANDDAAPAADLCIGMRQTPAGLSAWLRFDSGLYRRDSIVPLARQLVHLLGEADVPPTRALAELPLSGPAEQERVLRGFNALRVDFPKAATLASLIQDTCARQPDAICAAHGERHLSFAELDAAAARLAALLVAFGIGPGRFVAILDHRGIDFAIAMLAIWKAGGAYIPVDPSYPEDRVRYMLADSGVDVVIAGTRALATFADALAQCEPLRQVICPADLPPQAGAGRQYQVHGPAALAAATPLEPGAPRATAADPAYMVYTSGSTGRPKGAIVRHDGAVNHLLAQAHALGASVVARFLQSAPSSSDISVWQFAAPLALGGTTVIADDATDVERLHTLVRRYELGIIELVPVVLKYFIDYASSLPAGQRALPSLRWAMVTGESASVELVNAWLRLYPDIPVVNAYGPTEAADDITQAIIRAPLPANQVSVSIGQPLANLDIYVLDEALRPVPVGAPGEICVAGIGVGNGYWRQPGKTREAFVPNPFPGAAGPTLYRTGDLGRWRDDGTLDCFGRLDHQVQLRGFRIELQEIENVLRGHPAISDAVAQVFHDGRGDGQLVGYIVPRGEAPDDQALKAHLGASLPPYMVPSTFVRLDKLPLNPAGKVDRKALQPPQTRGVRSERPYIAPRTPAEQALAEVWRLALSVERVGMDDDFFALGGDSLAALAISVGARDAGLHLRSADVLAHPTVARLAAQAKPLAPSGQTADQTTAPPALPVVQAIDPTERDAYLAAHPECEAVLPLTPPQQGLFVHWLLARDKRAYVDQYCWHLVGELDPVAFEAAWNRVIQRHAVLRTGFVRAAPRQPAQVVHRAAPIAVAAEDYSALDDSAQAQALEQLLRVELDRGLDLARPPLMRLVLARLGPGRHYLVWTHHHIVVDGWSLSLVMNEVLRLHDTLVAGREPESSAPVPFADYVDWLTRQDAAPAEPFWRDQFQDWPGAPILGATPADTTVSGYGQVDMDLDRETSAALTQCAAERGVTLATLFQAAWALTLAHADGGRDVTFGVVSTGRDLPVRGIEAMVGLFVTSMPLRLRIPDPDQRGLADWLADIQRQAAQAREQEVIPQSLINRWAGLKPGLPLFETLFVMSNYPALDARPEARLRAEPGAYRTVPAFPLSVIIVPDEVARLRVNHERGRFTEAAVAHLGARFTDALRRLAAGRDPRQAG